MKVLVTRPAAQAGAWVDGLRQAGIEAEALPLIHIAAAADAAPLHAAWAALAGHRLVVFVSPNAAAHFFALRPAGLPWPAGVIAAAPGPGTAALLRRERVPEAQIAEPATDAAQFDSESLWARLAADDWRGAHALIVRGDGGRDWLAQRLREHGAQVDTLSVYRRVVPLLDAAQQALLAQALASPERHLWFFSSSEAIDHLERLRPGADWAPARALSTHPRIAARAQRLGIGRVRESRPTLAAVVACIQCLAP